MTSHIFSTDRPHGTNNRQTMEHIPTNHRGARISCVENDVAPSTYFATITMPDGVRVRYTERLIRFVHVGRLCANDRRRSFVAHIVAKIDDYIDREDGGTSWPMLMLGVWPHEEPPTEPASQGTTLSGESTWVRVKCDGLRRWKPIDSEIADLVELLQRPDRQTTTASCSGHGEGPGHVVLDDGRVLAVMPDLDTFDRVVEFARCENLCGYADVAKRRTVAHMNYITGGPVSV